MPRSTPRFGLTELNFLETSSDQVLNDLIARYESITGRTLATGDPVRLFLNTIAAEETQLREAFNLAARSNLLSYATGDYLDALGNYVNTPRILASAASVKLKFTLNSAVTASVYQIPKGTRVTNGLFTFATDELATIDVGESSAEVLATATTAGMDANGIPVGELKTMVDPLPELASVSNTEVSSGGADREDDDTYAQRIQLAPASFSVAGPHDAYLYHVLKFSSSIIDASVYGLTTNPGNVYIHPLLTGGEIPGNAFLTELSKYLSSDTIRPLTDNVLVSAPVAVDYSINLTWYLKTSDTASITAITNAVTAAVEQYRLWQQSAIGRDITPDYLIQLLMQAGVKRVVITTPVYTEVSKSQVAQCKRANVTISFGGTEDE